MATKKLATIAAALAILLGIAGYAVTADAYTCRTTCFGNTCTTNCF